MGLYGFFQYLYLFVEQVALMCLKNFSQKKRNGRQFWKDTIVTQFFVLLFIVNILFISSKVDPTPYTYDLGPLPPLSDEQPWGIFSASSKGNNHLTGISKRMYYSPNNHAGVSALINALVSAYPQIEAIGAADHSEVDAMYEENLFDTWAYLEFTLSSEQISTGQLVTSQTAPSVVSYAFLGNPSAYQISITTSNTTDDVYNKQQADADMFWSTGYFTIQNFVATYLAKQYPTLVPANYSIDTSFQRFPRSPIYPDKQEASIDTMRNSIWKWIGGPVLAVVLFLPMLGLLTEMVRERQFLMKDILEISGLMNTSYWTAYLLFIFAVCQLTMWFSIGFLTVANVFDAARVAPYASLLSVYIFGSAAFGMAFGFVIPRSEYYGLPVLLTTVALTVCGAYLGIANSINHSVKLLFCFMSPSVGLTMGVLVIESYLHSNGGPMDYDYRNDGHDYPSLHELTSVLFASGIVYFLLAVGMPFDWLFSTSQSEVIANAKLDEVRYPCDSEEATGGTVTPGVANVPAALSVTNLSQVYPDGTHALKDVTFDVKDGEVLSFLGANGAGKSTCMKMLCGTLEPSTGDATVNGFSITSQRVLARRNLGIAMQQDILWDDINVEDHLMLFGRLRGLHGTSLRTAVTEMAESLGFPEKRKFLAGTLSGGQKRRLCVGLSMVGGNKVVFLDEPSAGLDPVARRQLWELVQRNRAGRAILLTTHFMDEADVLGDRIAIVKEGRLRALGSSRFLKSRFGIGYLLRMSLREGAGPDPILKAVQAYVPVAAVSSHAGTELSIRLPREAVNVFAQMLEQLEKGAAVLGVLSFGIETTTLEEVFMRIVNEDNEQLLANHEEANRLLAADYGDRDRNRKQLERRDEQRAPLSDVLVDALLAKGSNAQGTSIWASLPAQTMVMLYKRYCQFVRSRGQWAMSVGVPLVLAIMVGALLSTMTTDLLKPDNDNTYATYTGFERTVVGGPSASATEQLVMNAFGAGLDTTYVGDSYGDVYTTIDAVASAGVGTPSVSGIYYASLTNFTVMYNASYPVDFAGAVQTMLNAAVANVTQGLLTIDQAYSTLPDHQFDSQLNSGFFVAMLVALVGGSFGAAVSIILSGERIGLVKHQQLASGASSLAYWLANFVFDFALMFSFVVVFAIVLAIFSPDTYGEEGFGYVLGAGFFFTVASIFRFYVFSYAISDVRLAQSLYFYGSIGLVFVLINVWFTLLFTTAHGNVNDGAVQTVAMLFAALDPSFGWYTIILYRNNYVGILTQNPGASFWSSRVAGGLLAMMVVSSVAYGIWFVVFTEKALSGCCRPSVQTSPSSGQPFDALEAGSALHPILVPTGIATATTMATATARGARGALSIERRVVTADPDVAAEQDKVRDIVACGMLDARSSAVFASNLRKVYYARGSTPSKVAVQNINLSIPQGEIFGLLGANGAGKTTLLKIVSGLEAPTSGFALINGFDIQRDTSQAQRSMGLCPQFDTLVERLTVRENLLFFGQIKGLGPDQLVPVAEAFMAAVNIKRYEHKLVQQLSGGNRRKVSLVVALMGAPPTTYLDEPSTGLDPVASRLMWRLLSKIAAAKATAIVLTTHNMLECEAVCTRVCIMKMGQMVCLGDSQHLRSTHGTGFQLEVTLKAGEADAAEEVKQFVAQRFAGAALLEEQPGMLNYEIPRAAIAKLSQAFKLLQDHQAQLGVQDYVLSQSTLEQVFLKQIRVNESDLGKTSQGLGADQQDMDRRVPNTFDYVSAYLVMIPALLLPGLHHFYLGNFWRGVKYLFTFNEVLSGWLLDLLELHVLVQRSVQEHGHTRICGCFRSKPQLDRQNVSPLGGEGL